MGLKYFGFILFLCFYHLDFNSLVLTKKLTNSRNLKKNYGVLKILSFLKNES